MRYTTRIFLIVFSCFASVLTAQFDLLRNYNVKDGLPSSDTYDIIQDSKGYIWISGDAGVSRFNGYEFKNFSIENGLPDNSVFGIHEDKKGRIWFRSFSGKLAYFKNDSIHTLPCNDTLATLIKFYINSSLHIDDGDSIWMGVTNKLIIKINPGWKTGGVKKIPVDSGKYICFLPDKGFIFGGGSTRKEIITAYNSNIKKLFVVDPGIYNKTRVAQRYYFSRSKDGSFMASIGKNIFRFNATKILGKTSVNTAVISLTEDKDSSIIVATYSGLFVFSGNNLKFKKQVQQLEGKVITGVCIGREDELWYTTEGHGLYCQAYRNFKYYTAQNGISNNKITCMMRYGNGVVCGYLNETLNVLKKDSISTIYFNKQKGFKANHMRVTGIYNLFGKIYISSVVDILNLEGTNLRTVNNIVAVKKMVESNDRNVWVLQYGNLLKCGPQKNFPVFSDMPLKTRFDNLFEDSKGLLWLCAINGVYTYDGKNFYDLGLKEKLLRYRPVEIAENADHKIIITTRGGGVIVKKGETIFQINEKKGLASNMCKGILIDSNIAWIGTNKGLSKITFNKNNNHYTVENVYAKDGLLSNEVNCVLKIDNKLWVAHNNCITVFDPSTLHAEKYAPPVYITRFLVKDSAYPLNKNNTLAFNQNYISISYEGLSFKNAGNIEYKYRLNSIDPGWVHSNYTTIKYQSLAAGNYTFEVYAKSNDGTWSEAPATITFTILHAWWDTWWFITLCIILSAGLVGLLFKYRLDSIRKTEFEKEMLRHRISTIELQALRSQMNPHFVFNAINSVQYFITGNDPVSSQKYLEKFASLIRYVLDNSKLAPVSLKTEIEALYLYLELEALRFKFKYQIEINESVDAANTRIPSMLIQPYLENAIWHGLMHKKSPGQIVVTFDVKNKVLICTIEDNGIGREKSGELRRNNPSALTHKSLGMNITKERLDIINKINKVNLSITVTDLPDSSGTRIQLNIPIQV